MRTVAVRAARDNNAGVWRIESSDINGLRVEGDTFEHFCRNISDAAVDLLHGEKEEISIEFVALG